MLHGMMKRIMTPRAAAVAFAASALAIAPAVADPGHGQKYHTHGTSADLHLNFGNGLAVSLNGGNVALRNHHSSYRYHDSRYRHSGYDRRYDRYHTKRLRREAIRACSDAVKYAARDRGFRRVHIDDVEGVRQIGPEGFRIRAEFEFEGRRRDFERDVTCTVRRGRVVDIDNLPRPRGYRHSGYRGGYARTHPGYRY